MKLTAGGMRLDFPCLGRLPGPSITAGVHRLQDNMEREVDAYLRRKFESAIKEVEVVRIEDLELKNHLSGLQRTLLKASFPPP